MYIYKYIYIYSIYMYKVNICYVPTEYVYAYRNDVVYVHVLRWARGRGSARASSLSSARFTPTLPPAIHLDIYTCICIYKHICR